MQHPAAGTNKRLSVERIYQRKTQLEHILLRPDTYIGSVEETTETMYVYDSEKEAIVKKQITFVPGLYKIFDEILGKKFPFRFFFVYSRPALVFFFLIPFVQ